MKFKQCRITFQGTLVLTRQALQEIHKGFTTLNDNIGLFDVCINKSKKPKKGTVDHHSYWIELFLEERLLNNPPQAVVKIFSGKCISGRIKIVFPH